MYFKTIMNKEELIKKHPHLKQLIYPLLHKYPTIKIKGFFLRTLLPAIILCLIFFVSSCKTCKCPAYTRIQETPKVEISS